MRDLTEWILWFLIACGLFFSLLAGTGCDGQDQAWRPRDYCQAVADEFCSCPWADDSPCWRRVYRTCQDEVDGYVPADAAETCLSDIEEQACLYTRLPDSCP